MQSNSAFGSVNLIDLKKTAIHLALAALASLGLYLIDAVYPQIHFSGTATLFVPVFSTLVDFARRYLTNYQTSQDYAKVV